MQKIKRTFIFYNDWIDYTNEMTLEEKGLFLETILKYQNGTDIGDISSIKFVWSRVKKQIDEDNTKWEEELKKRSEAGKKGMENRWHKITNDNTVITDDKSVIKNNNTVIKNITKITDNVNVNDNVYNKENNIELDELIEKRNNIKIKDRNGLPRIIKKTNDLQTIWNKTRKEYSIEDIKLGINNYCKDIMKRNITTDYANHRFTLFEFLKQKNGLITFINKN